jgi:hypothetical protein
MSQRYPYWPQYHGNYYFRPYHMQRVIEQRQIATSWGEDPRNPYGNLVFDRIYEQMQADEAANAEALPQPPVTPVPPPLNEPKPASNNGVTPKPLPMRNTPMRNTPMKDSLDGLPPTPQPVEPKAEPDSDRQGSNRPLRIKLAK